MKYKVAINGFGRIGRLTLRSLLNRNLENLEIVAVNDLGDLKSNLHLFKYDSVHGTLNDEINIENSSVQINNHKIIFYSEPNPANLNWDKLNIDLVLECTGIFTKREEANKHLNSGSKRVLISAPAVDPDIT